MEESEKRRERIKAMRLEATSNSNDSVSSSSSQQTLNYSTPLANPLLDNPDSNSASTPTHRFDFYTDPMAAYATTDKRRLPTPTSQFPQSSFGPRNPRMRPPPGVQQFQNNYGPQPSPPGVQQFQNNYGPQRPPSGVQQFQNNHGPQPPPYGVQHFQNNYGPHQGMYQGGDPYYSPGPALSPMGMRSPCHPVNQGSPNFSNAPGRGEWFNNRSPGSGCGDSPYPMYQGSPNVTPPPQGRGHWSNNSPRPGPGYGGGWSPSVGRGRGQWDNRRISSSSGYSGGRGRGRGYSGGRGYGDGQGPSFYNKSMVEDPWESLTPVIWQGEKENDVRSSPNNRGCYQKTPFEKAPFAKKPRVSNIFDASNSKNGGSLADFLAESFDEAGEDAATV